MKRLLPLLCGVVLTLPCVRTAHAQPANDNFANAWVLTGTVLTTNGNSGQNQAGIPNATKEANEPNHAGLPGGRSVWFRWTAPTNGQTRIDTIGSDFNTLLGVYTGTAVSALTQIAANDNISEGFGGNSRSRVEFFATAGTTYRIAIDGRSGFSGQNPASGPYVLNMQMLASVFISTPTNGSIVPLGTTIPVHVEASVPGASVTRVDLFRTGGLFGSVTNPPYDFTVISPPPGTNSFVAVAVDSAGLSWTSAVANVAVLSIGLNLVSPSDGSVFLNTNPISVSALPLLQSGAMTNVEFFVDGVKFAQDATSPFSAVWTNVTGGAHRFTATGKDNLGNTHNAAAVNIAVAQALVARGAVWKFLDTGVDQGTNWTAIGFDDGSWNSGPAELGYGDSGDNPPRPEATVVGFGPDPENKFTTTYFRHAFQVPDAAAYSGLIQEVLRDDGAVVYLNGVEIGRYNMPAGPVVFSTFANNAQDDGTTYFVAGGLSSALVSGNNVLAVEIHQNTPNSTDISFDMDLLGVPRIIRNQSPSIQLVSPTNNAPFLAPSAIVVAASAVDIDGSVTNVDFYADNVKLGSVTEEPYEFVWNNPPTGLHTLSAVATDNQGASSSAQVTVAVHDSFGTPLVDILSPAHGSVFNGPTNVIISARVTALSQVTEVLFLTNGVDLLTDTVSPYTVVWTNAAFGSNTISVLAADSDGRSGFSGDISIFVIAPPTNTVAPTITSRVPAAGINVTSLTNITVTFSERVVNVDAADLLVNLVPAAAVTGSISNYTFSFPQPPYGEVEVHWAANHGITDIGYPSNLAFNANGPGSAWAYNLIDAVAPTIATRVPAAGAAVTNLTQVSVTFSEPVGGVNAADLLVNGSPALGLSGGPAAGTPSSYTFSFSQPAGGTVNISWVGAHGIADLSPTPNPFNATGPGATWSYTLDLRTVLVQSNSTWRFLKGFAEASAPIDAWRQPGFDDSGWSNAPAPFFYGDTTFTNAANRGTAINDMNGGAYSSIYLRNQFNVLNASSVTNLFLVAAIDDGAIVWINGTEALRNNMAGGDIPYNGSAPAAANEPNNNGVPYTSFTLANANNYLLEGPNTITVHAFNNQPASSSDFCWNAQLYAFVLDPTLIPPRVTSVSPVVGDVFHLTNLTVRFTEPVSGVDAGDLLVNGVAATGLSSTTNTTYTFSFEQPAFGAVNITWAAGHGIADFDALPKPFDSTAPGATFQYSLLNPSAPTITLQSPLAGSSVPTLTQVTVTFSEPVTGVDASDLRINSVPADGVSGSSTTYTFTFPQPPYGAVSIGWITGHGITDTEGVPPAGPNPFDGTRPGHAWTYTLVDQIQPTIVSKSPPAGALVTNLTQLSVTFSEPVTGVNASDLLINGTPASGVNGSGAGPYTFNFAQANATLVNVTWANSHGIRDLAPVPNSFDATGAGATWSYATPDTLPPTVVVIDPRPFVTLRSLTRIAVTFTEPVVGVDTNDLLLNGRRAISVSGSAQGPYTFNFLPPSNGVAEVRWVTGHLISDLAVPLPNSFDGGEWNYTVDPAATFAGKVIISELMFHPSSDRVADEWLELHNVSSNLVNLAGWRFSRGADFTFPNVAIPAGGYLVVAADTNAFKARYPGVNNVIGNWTGRLANSDETIELVTPLEESANTVHYATEGDWAFRARGRPAQRVSSITRAGTTATVTVPQHGYNNNETVFLTGADQPEYNGRFNIANAGSSTFTITVAGAPASPATGTIVCRHIVDNNASGWSWYSAADGFGSSLELVNSALPNSVGQNWAASTTLQGTPGAPNSTRATNVAPFIIDASHFPPVPLSADAVTISARVQDESSNGIAAVTLFWRNHSTSSPGSFTPAPMFDDGTHNDGVANDKLYAVALPQQTNRAVIEFFLQAADTSGLTRTWPAPAWQTNNTFAQTANALFQVDDQVPSTNMPFLRLVLTETERAEFAGINQNSDAEMNATFISIDGDGTKVRYGCGVRIRGAGSRGGNPRNWRVNIPTDNRWNDLSEINLNTRYIHAQLAGSILSQKAGLPVADARVVQVRLNGNNLAPAGTPQNGGGSGAGFGSYVLVEPLNGDFAANHFPNDGQGNVYRASSGPHDADLANGGMNIDFYYARGYSKTSNQSDNDWNDMANLTAALSTGLPDASYVQAVRTNVNVEMWMRFFAVCTYFGYGETALGNGIGDDYAMYRGMNDSRFILLAHDFDTILNQGDTTTYWPVVNAHIWMMLNPPNPNGDPATLQTTLQRFMRHPEHAPVYFAELKRLADGPFSAAQANPVLDQILSGWGPDQTLTIAPMKNYLANRRAALMTQVPLTLTVSNTLPTQSGFPFAVTPGVTLSGTANAIETRSVRVNGSLAVWSAWEARWTHTLTLQPGINRVLVQSFDSNNVEFARATVDIWHDDGSVQTVSGVIATDTSWSAAGGPYQVTANLTVGAGVTLTIQPGTTVYLSPGVDITVANGGRLLAEGLDTARIRFSAAPGAGNWGGLTVNGGASSPETRIAYTHFDGNSDTAIHSTDGTVFLDHLTFGNPAEQYVSLDRSSFVVQDCVFPATTASFEPTHGSGGIKAGGRGIFRRNFFGRIIGYNDALDFTGGNRPGPILQVLNNVFMGSDDDLLDLDSTDAWVEGNIFLHTHRNGSPDSASAISGGADNADTSQVTAVGNLFFDVDHAALAKQGGFYTLVNNTIVHQTKVGSQDTNTAVVILADDGTAQGAGMYLEGNIILDAENLTRNVTTALVTYTNNIIHQLVGTPWTGAGGNNVNSDPLLTQIPSFSVTSNFTSWAQAQVMWDYFSLRNGSPAQGTGPNGRDKGAVASSPSPLVGERAGVRGVSISGEPVGATRLTTATLRVGLNRTGNGIPTAGFPDGSGFTHYRWRLDGGAWSAETPIATPITLSSLSSGPHYVEVTGKNDAGFYQDDPVFGSDALVTVSRTWTVNPAASPLRLNEILASNGGSVNYFGTTPDVVELHNASDAALDVAGVRITDDLAAPEKFSFPAGASIPARGYLLVYADSAATPGHHLRFTLPQSGGALYVFASTVEGGALVDSASFGLQITDLSVGRLADGSWALTQPTFGAVNRPAPMGDPRALRINEWLTLGDGLSADDFVELYNPQSLPVALGGLFLSDEPTGWPDRHPIAALSFTPGFGYQRFIADGESSAGAEHLDFSLNGDQGMIALSAPDLSMIDCIAYTPQSPGVSQGRSPNGSGTLGYFSTPTPGGPNPLIITTPTGGALVINEVLAQNASLGEVLSSTNVVTPDWIELYNGSGNPTNLTGLSLSDNSTQPRKYVFPDGTILPPGGFLRIVCDTDSTSENPLVNTNFNIRASGGAVYLFDSPSYGGNLLNSITYGLQIADFAVGRVPDGSGNWALTLPSPGGANIAATLGNPANLKVNEWFANSPNGEDDWFELYNPDAQPVSLGELALTDDLASPLKHRIAGLSFIGAGTNAWQQFRADGNTGAGADHVGFSLNQESEDIGLSFTNNDAALINGYSFGPQLPGVSEGRFPDGSTNVVSFPGTASPGESNWRLLTDVVINEVLTHTDQPFEDAIELHNLNNQSIDVGGWWLSDDNGTLQKYQIPSPTVIPANSYVVIYENQFTNRVLAVIPFALSSKGDEVVLSAAANNALTGYRTRVDFGAAANSVSFGRYVSSDGRSHLVAMNARTFGVDDPGNVEDFRTGTGLPNSLPRVGPVVISEIMYHPPDIGTNDNARDEFIELRNITTVPVPLFDSTNSWRLRGAVDFDFPLGTELPPGGHLLVASFDPVNNSAALAAFRAAYGLSSNTVILGPWSGRLANDTEDVELRRPDTPDAEDVPYVLVERVRYSHEAPWPNEADGTGFSLQRLAEDQFANDPSNWTAAPPTAGPDSTTTDSDGDGLPDSWEIAFGFDPFNPADASLDSDGDGLTNLQEFQLGSDPRDASSGLRLNIALAPGGTSVLLSFTAAANYGYGIVQTDALGTAWQSLQSFAPVPTNRVVQLSVPASASHRFYRLRIESSPVPDLLRVNSIQTAENNQVLLHFSVPANQGCTVLFKPVLSAASWTAVTQFQPAPTNQVLQLLTPATGNSGFYRLRSP